MNKPKALLKGDKVAIVSLSSGMLGDESCKHDIEIGTRRLKEFGIEPVFMKNSLKGIDYLEDHPEARAQDLKDAFMDDSIKGIICAIGGDDTYKLLPYLLEDEEFKDAVKNNPKLFTGYSDTTINHLMFYKLGMVTYYGPNFICDLAELSNEMLPYTKEAFKGYFKESQVKYFKSSEFWYEERTDFLERAVGTDKVRHKEERGYEILQGHGVFKGKLLGGCLESFYDILTNTRYPDEKDICERYSIFPSLDEWKDKILFIETCEETPTPEEFEKELTELMNTGIFEVIRGIIVGKPQDEAYYEEYKEILKKVINNKEMPILYNINFGHAYPRCIIPYGIETEIDMDNKKITFKESLFI